MLVDFVQEFSAHGGLHQGTLMGFCTPFPSREQKEMQGAVFKIKTPV
jgi:hypothetical protein